MTDTTQEKHQRVHQWPFYFRPWFWAVAVPAVLVLAVMVCGSLCVHYLVPGFGRFETVMSVAALILGEPLDNRIGDVLPSAFQGGKGHLVHALRVIRVLALLVPAYAFFILAAATFSRPVQWLRILYWRMSPWYRYVVVCGLGWKGHELVHDIIQRRHAVPAKTSRSPRHLKIVVIEKDTDNPFVESVTGPGVVVLRDDATKLGALERASIRSADRIYVTGDDDETNCRIVKQITYLSEDADPPPCLPKPKKKKKGADSTGHPNGEQPEKTSIPATGDSDQPRAAAVPTDPVPNQTMTGPPCERCLERHSSHEYIQARVGVSKVAGVLRQKKWRTRKARVLRAVGQRPRRVQCLVHIKDPHMRAMLENTTRGYDVDVFCFNVFETTARRLLARHHAVPLGARRDIHVVIYGSTPIAQGLLLHVLRSCHVFRERQRRITVYVDVDRHDRKAFERAFLSQYPWLSPNFHARSPEYREMRDTVFPEIEFLDLPRSSADLLCDDAPLFQLMREGWQTSAFVCLDDGIKSESYRQLLYQKLATRPPEEQQWTTLFQYYNYPEHIDRSEDGSEEAEADTDGGPEVVRFGSFAEECSLEAIEGMGLDALARQIMASYYQDRLAALPELDRACFIQRLWENCDEWEKSSNRQAADHLLVKLRCIGLSLSVDDGGRILWKGDAASDSDLRRRIAEDIEQLAETEHRRWCAEKMLDGWMPVPRTPENVAAWFGDDEKARKAFQQRFKDSRQHMSLIPFDRFDEFDHCVTAAGRSAARMGEETIAGSERKKDLSQIEAIPDMLLAASREQIAWTE